MFQYKYKLMAPRDIIQLRLSNQLLAGNTYTNPSDVVKHMCAMQAQDYLGSLWAVALRTENSSEEDIELAIAGKKIVRTWPMRGTLHYVAPEDVRWLLKLTASRILKGQTKRLLREFEIDEQVLSICRRVLITNLQDGKQLARNDVYRVLEEKGIPATGQRGLHIIWYLAHEGLLCFGPRIGKQPSFVLLDEWIPQSRELSAEEALAELIYRYFSTRGPATMADFIWWTGLNKTLATTALQLAKHGLENFKIGEKEYWMSTNQPVAKSREKNYHLLPPFDEYLIAYADRSLMLGEFNIKDIVPYSNGMFFPVMAENGMILGTWKRTKNKNSVKVEFSPFKAITQKQRTEFKKVQVLYEKFLKV